jgi:ankyrin repeat protein
LNDDVEPGFDALLADELAAASTEVRDLFEACSAAEPHRLRELLDAKADVNLALHETATPLTTVIQASTRGSASDPLACIRLLLEAKARPDESVFASDSGTPIGVATPLILACAKEDHALVDLLLEHHASPDRTGTLSDGCHPMTPLMVAASRGAVEVAESLLRAGDH